MVESRSIKAVATMNATLDGVRSANRGLDALTHRVEAGMANLMNVCLSNAAEQQRNGSSTQVRRLLAQH